MDVESQGEKRIKFSYFPSTGLLVTELGTSLGIPADINELVDIIINAHDLGLFTEGDHLGIPFSQLLNSHSPSIVRYDLNTDETVNVTIDDIYPALVGHIPDSPVPETIDPNTPVDKVSLWPGLLVMPRKFLPFSDKVETTAEFRKIRLQEFIYAIGNICSDAPISITSNNADLDASILREKFQLETRYGTSIMVRKQWEGKSKKETLPKIVYVLFSDEELPNINDAIYSINYAQLIDERYYQLPSSELHEKAFNARDYMNCLFGSSFFKKNIKSPLGRDMSIMLENHPNKNSLLNKVDSLWEP